MMGRHSPPLDGTVTANGRALAPLVMQPLQQDDKPAPRWHADGDTVIRVLAAIVVLAVAAFGAIVSYSHIFALGHAHGQDGTAARLLPLSVDGLIAAASLVMLHAARRKLPVPRLARAMLVTGVIATVAANVLDGLPPAWIGPVVSALIGAAVSAWPAVAFIGCAEMVVQFVRDARQDGGAAVLPHMDKRVDKQADMDRRVDKQADMDNGHAGKPPPRKAVPARAALDKAAAAIADNPGLAEARAWTALAGIAGVSAKTVQRAANGTAKT